jgi:outer membrane protein assembly factor BamB
MVRGRPGVAAVLGVALLMAACGHSAQQAGPSGRPSVTLVPTPGMPGANVVERATVIALDASDGHERWRVQPPLVIATPTGAGPGRLRLDGATSRDQCDFNRVVVVLNAATGALATATPQPNVMSTDNPDSVVPPLVDGPIAIHYFVGHQKGPSTGLRAVDLATKKTLWRMIVTGDSGPALLRPPVYGSGVVAATFGGDNPFAGTPAVSVGFIDEQRGEVLWRVSNGGRVAIGHGLAYLLTANAIEARDVRTGTIRWRLASDAAQITANDEAVVVSGAQLTSNGSPPSRTTTVAYDYTGRQLWRSEVGVIATDPGITDLLASRDTVFITLPGRYKTPCND